MKVCQGTQELVLRLPAGWRAVHLLFSFWHNFTVDGSATTWSAILGYNRRTERVDAMPAHDPQLPSLMRARCDAANRCGSQIGRDLRGGCPLGEAYPIDDKYCPDRQVTMSSSVSRALRQAHSECIRGFVANQAPDATSVIAACELGISPDPPFFDRDQGCLSTSEVALPGIQLTQ